MEQIIEQLDKYIDVKLMCLIVIASYWAKKFLIDVAPKITLAHKVLLFSTLVTVLYYLVLIKTGVFKKEDVPVYIISYLAATSFYELFFAPLERWVRKITGTPEKGAQHDV